MKKRTGILGHAVMRKKESRVSCLPAGEAALDTSATQEPTTTDETEQRDNGIGPQESLEETGCTVGGSVLGSC
jgi:hypothetical protein